VTGLLPVGLVLALVLGMILPEPGLWLGGARITFALIAIIFFINGYQTHPRTLKITRRLGAGFFIAALLSFGGGAALGHLAAFLPGLDPAMVPGLLVMSVMAPTLSSVIVITHESGGNTTWAALLTMGINLLGIFVIPPMLSGLLAGGEVALPAMKLFRDLVLSVLLPFCLGLGLRATWNRLPHRWVNKTPTLLVILLSYVSFSSGRASVLGSGWEVLAAVIAAVCAIHFGLLLLAALVTALCRFAPDERKAITFLSSQKTLPMAIGVLTALGYSGGPALLPCVLFHFCQILVDSVIADRWRARGAAHRPARASAVTSR